MNDFKFLLIEKRRKIMKTRIKELRAIFIFDD